MESHPRSETTTTTVDKDAQRENEASLLRNSNKVIGGAGEAVIGRQMDGGVRAWVIVLSSFLCNGLIFGVINSYSCIYSVLQRTLELNGVEEASGKAALVGSLTLGTTFILSPLAGVVTDKIGMRWTTVLGGIFTSSGMFLSSYALQNINILYWTYGVMYGIGAAFTYSPSLAVLGHYFDRYLGKVSGFATTGSSVFTAAMPFVCDYLLETRGLPATLRVLAMLSSLIFVCALLYESPTHTHEAATVAEKDPLSIKAEQQKTRSFMKVLQSAIYVDNWKKKRYVIWVLSITISQFGYFIPYVHMFKYVNKNFPGFNPNLPVACIGVASGVGRLIFGFVADLPWVNRIVLHQISVALVGIATLILSGLDSYSVVIVCVLALGLADGCYVTLMGPIAIEICGARGGSQAIGFLLGFCSIPLTIGPVVAGLIYDRTDSYSTVFLVSGLSPIIATIFMFLIRCVRDDQVAAIGGTEASTAKPAWKDVELHSLTKEPEPKTGGLQSVE